MAESTDTFAGRQLRLARVALGLRQRDLGRRVGVPGQRISEWELGLRMPTLEQAARLRSVLKQTAEVRLLQADRG